MSLLARINAALGAVLLLAALVTGLLCWKILEGSARREVLAEAALMLDSAAAARTYTATEILPLIVETKDKFPPQSVPFYAATQSFLKFHELHPDYAYKEATLNPTNPRDRASDWENDIIQRFRNDLNSQQVIAERDTAMGRFMYLARPIRATPECLACHSTPAAAPASLIARYGSDNGFGWGINEIVGAQVISVPFADATANAHRQFRAFLLLLAAVFAATFLAVNLLLYRMVVMPIRRIAAIADQASLGAASIEEFPQGGAPEIASVARSFERMRKSLEKALRILGS
jgi:HAMP domain-containing protein